MDNYLILLCIGILIGIVVFKSIIQEIVKGLLKGICIVIKTLILGFVAIVRKILTIVTYPIMIFINKK